MLAKFLTSRYSMDVQPFSTLNLLLFNGPYACFVCSIQDRRQPAMQRLNKDLFSASALVRARLATPRREAGHVGTNWFQTSLTTPDITTQEQQLHYRHASALLPIINDDFSRFQLTIFPAAEVNILNGTLSLFPSLILRPLGWVHMLVIPLLFQSKLYKLVANYLSLSMMKQPEGAPRPSPALVHSLEAIIELVLDHDPERASQLVYSTTTASAGPRNYEYHYLINDRGSNGRPSKTSVELFARKLVTSVTPSYLSAWLFLMLHVRNFEAVLLAIEWERTKPEVFMLLDSASEEGT